MEKEFVLYPEALELKELGFDEPCFGFYTEEYKTLVKNFCKYPINLPTKPFLAPTFSQAFRFFRDKHGLFVQPNATSDSTGVWYYFSIATKRTDVCEGSFVYEEAELACLRKLIEIVKTKQ